MTSRRQSSSKNEGIEKDALREFSRANGFELPAKIIELYRHPLLSSRGGELFNAFSYPTKISPEAIALFIATHTKPGGVVLDTFAGSGTTGLAAMLCDMPTPAMKAAALEMGISPQWGPRKAFLYELSTLGAFVAEVLTAPPDVDEFQAAASELLEQAKAKVAWMYVANGPDGSQGEIRHVIWSDVLRCPNCSKETTYWDAVVAKHPLRMRDSFRCAHCGKTASIEGCERVAERVKDPLLGTVTKRRKRQMAEVHGKTGNKKWKRPATEADVALWRKVEKTHSSPTAPTHEIEWGELFRAGYHTGISHLHHFYTWRNFQVLSVLWELANKAPARLRKALRFLILSYNATHSTLMTRVVVKRDQKELVLTGAQSGVLYISGLPVEKNILEGLARKIGVISRAFSAVEGSRSKVEVVNKSSASLAISARTVDYVFTDPPFGDYIPYAEINQINEAWLGKLTKRKDEVIVSASQRKGVGEYAELMARVFSEIGRTIKNHALVTVVFHSAKPAVWSALSSSYQAAGLALRATSVLDKTQSSFKQVVSEGSVKGDPILLLGKEVATRVLNGHSNGLADRIANDIISRAASLGGKEGTPQRLYARMVARCLEENVAVPMSATEFYGLIKFSQMKKTQ